MDRLRRSELPFTEIPGSSLRVDLFLLYRFQNTKQPELRFHALLIADAQTVRFELTPVDQKDRSQISLDLRVCSVEVLTGEKRWMPYNNPRSTEVTFR